MPQKIKQAQSTTRQIAIEFMHKDERVLCVGIPNPTGIEYEHGNYWHLILLPYCTPSTLYEELGKPKGGTIDLFLKAKKFPKGYVHRKPLDQSMLDDFNRFVFFMDTVWSAASVSPFFFVKMIENIEILDGGSFYAMNKPDYKNTFYIGTTTLKINDEIEYDMQIEKKLGLLTMKDGVIKYFPNNKFMEVLVIPELVAQKETEKNAG